MSPEKEESKPKTPEVSQTGDDIEIGDSISMSPEKEESKPKTPEVSQTLEQETESNDNIEIGDSINVIQEKKDTETSSSESPSPEESILPQPQIDVRRGLSLDSQQSTEGSVDDNSSISIGSDIDIDEMTKVSSVKKSIGSLDSQSVSPADSDDFEDFERDITGTQLNNPYYFQARMEKRDPVLFVKSMDDPKFKAYSRMCPSNVRRQPVILTEKEKERIDKEHPGSYSHSVKYGSDPNKQFFYICPRYWCIKDNTSLTEEEVNAGVCGGRDAIIPARASKIPKGKYIYEFNVKREHDDGKGNYIEHAPGFLSKKKHPKGMCLPCCFKNWDAPEQKRRRDVCAQTQEDKPTKPPPAKRQISLVVDDYIKDETKFPLEQNRWGVLPLVLQNFLSVDKRSCSLSGSKLSPFKECLLRHGVEVNKKQSFIACLSDLYVQYIKGNNIPTINEMREYISNVVTLDVFMESHNGNLVKIFSKESSEEINLEEYRDSQIYNSLDLSNELHKDFLKNVVIAHKNFINYLNDDDIVIDYRYLWDIVCSAGVLFPAGINLVILEIVNNDLTQNVQLICPTNHYMSKFFDPRKSAFILLKQGDYYEPIYLYEDIERQIKVQKTFHMYNPKLALNLKKVLNVVKKHLDNSCKPLPSMPRVYTFVENNGLENVIEELKKINATIDSLVMNYNSKIIGLMITYKERSGFIPCYPSGVMNIDKPIKTIDDPSLWKNYEETNGFLLLISAVSKRNILCKPLTKVIEDELVVGILTETNQFIQLSQPEMPIEDGLKSIKESNFLLTDSETLINKNIDFDRIKYVRRIRLEKNFYDVFRNSLRILLNKYENRKVREEIQTLIESNELYYTKMNTLIGIIKNLLNELVEFVEYDENILMEMEQISSCLTSSECNKPYCMKNDTDNCKLLIPKINLLNELDNEIVYYAKISDELLRFNRIKLFIFDPKTHLSFGSVSYNLNDNEIILLSSLLNQDYFRDLVPVINNSYITSNTYDTANPIKSQVYSSIIDTDNKQSNSDCKTKVNSKISGKWQSSFDADFKEITYANDIKCTYTIILNIMKELGITDKTIVSLKTDLLREYTRLFELGHKDMILLILEKQGKKSDMRKIKSNLLKFENYIISEHYYLTNLDIWLLARIHNLGITILSRAKLIENNDFILPLVYPENNQYFFISVSRAYDETIPKYKLIVNSNNNGKLSFSSLKRNLQKKINDTKTLTKKGFTLEKLLRDFKPIKYPQRKKAVKKKKLTLVSKSDSLSVASSIKKAKKKKNKLKLTKN